MFLNNHIPNKSLGQNFLHDTKVINRIIYFINPQNQDCLLEIGPGLAALTKPICLLIKKLFVIEIDKKLLILLKKYGFYNQLHIFETNVMHFNFKNLSNHENRLLRIFGNLPYNISVSLILKLIQYRKYIFDIHFMVQKEVALRLTAQHGTKYYGRLSIIAQCYYNITCCFNVYPESFYPKPKVESILIKIVPKSLPLYPYNQINNLSKVTALAFQKRRKILKNSLSSILDLSSLLNLNIDPFLRAENLSIHDYCKIANFVNFYNYSS